MGSTDGHLLRSGLKSEFETHLPTLTVTNPKRTENDQEL